MDRKICLMTVSVFVFLGLTAAALAETVDGRVADVSRNALDLTVYNDQGMPYPNKLRLKMDSLTRMYGFSYQGVPQKQDVVRAAISQERVGVWRADSLNRLDPTITSQQPTKPVTQSMMEAINSPTGQKLVRGGLTGAITGAVASAASGGKTIKGALVGAGVGAIGGFVADLFGQGQEGQQAQPTQMPAANSQNWNKG